MSDVSRLEITALHAYYGESHVLRDIHLTVDSGETIALLGRNGVGKTTTLKCIAGWVRAASGALRYNGISLADKSMAEIAQLGIALVPEERRIFTNLTVYENLKLAMITARERRKRVAGTWSLEAVYERFPRLQERANHRGDEISGGEKQILAIARALVQGTRLLLLDEPSEGLAPLIVRDVEATIRELKASGMTIVLVEQNVVSALRLADRVYIIDQGTICFSGTPRELENDSATLHRYLAV